MIMTDKTRVPSSSGSVVQVRSGKPNRHARDEPNHFKRHRFNRAVGSGYAPSRPLARCSATPTELPRPGHASWSLPSAHCSPGGAPGISPFADLLPPTGGLDITAEPGPHAVCVARPSRLIFVGTIDRRVEIRSRGGRPRTFLNDATSASGLRSRLRSVSPAPCRGPILPWVLPLAGLWARCCAFDRARPRSDHQSPGKSCPLSRGSYTIPNPLMGLRRPSRQRCGQRELLGESHPCLRRHVRRGRRPFSVLMGLMPRQPERPRARPGQAPCLRFRTFREKR
jgi:hypothetical protein